MAGKAQHWYSIVLHLLLIGLAFQVVTLTRDNRQLRQSATTTPPPEQVGPGDILSPSRFVDVDGGPARLELIDPQGVKDKLLLVFSTTCPACNDNRPVWMDLYEQAQDRYEIVGVSLSGAQESRRYAEDHALPFPVVLPENPQSFTSENRIVGVPTTLRVDTDGTVQDVWLGVLAQEQVRQLANDDLG